MRIIVENFGPIKKADVTLKDLTIFVGPGGSGKSYLAYLIWLLYRVSPKFEYYSRLFRFIEKISEKIEKNKRITEEDIKKILNKAFEITEKALREEWKDGLKDVFRVENLKDLINKGAKKSVIIVCNDKCNVKIEIKITKKGFYVNGIRKIPEYLDVDIEENIIFIYLKDHEKYPILSKLLPRKYDKEEIFEYMGDLSIETISTAFNILFQNYVPYHFAPYILPDSRAGILRAYKYILGRIISERVAEPILGLADRDMLKTLATLDLKVKDKEISSIADFLEEKIGGKFILKHYDRFAPEIEFVTKKVNVPLLRAQSSARELAPLIIFMRHVLEKNSFFVVEEPEAHCHPYIQSIVARGLALLSKYCNVLVTTHSSIFLDEIDNLIKLNKLSKKEKEKLNYRDDEGLSYENVGIYRFKVDGTVEKVEISENGIREEEFSSVIAELFNRYADVEEIFESKRISRKI